MLLRELKRRKVTRTCIIYVVVCWGVLQVGDIVFPALGLDADVASRYCLYLAVAGFPLTFALAWFFQITPEGIVRTTPFVERRVLSNMAPINDRRSRGLSQYIRKDSAESEYDWILVAESGPLAGLSFGIDREVVLGRGLDCDLTLISPHVSRRHAALSLEQDGLYITDLGSSNGTVINGRAISTRQALQNNDELRFNDIVFRIDEANVARRSTQQTEDKTVWMKTAYNLKDRDA